MDSTFVERLALGGDGPPVALKDVFDVAGYPTRLGSRARAEAPPATRHAAVVARLLACGCRIVGKTNLHELAYGVTGINAWTGTPPNRRFPDRVPGGSSSGSAVAVASGTVAFALGTDTGGSIRVPAACCGVVGLKPSFGRIDRTGVYPRESSLDCVGPLALSVATVEQAMSMLDPAFRGTPSPRRPRIGLVAVEADPIVLQETHAALARLEAHVGPVSLPGLGEAFEAGLAIIAAETWAAYGDLLATGRLGADVAERLRAARSVSRASVSDAEEVRRRFTNAVDAALDGVDALALPTMPVVPPSPAEARGSSTLHLTALVRPFNLSGHPAISLPIGRAPIGLQLVGRRGEDAALCAVARQIEAALASDQAAEPATWH